MKNGNFKTWQMSFRIHRKLFQNMFHSGVLRYWMSQTFLQNQQRSVKYLEQDSKIETVKYHTKNNKKLAASSVLFLPFSHNFSRRVEVPKKNFRLAYLR